MAGRLGDLVSERALAGFVGRECEMATLEALLAEGGPLMVFVHGVAGIGKSTLLDAFAAQARAGGVPVLRLDCRAIEPTPRGFLAALSTALDRPVEVLPDAAEKLSGLGGRAILALDTYEHLRLLDTWIRQSFVPELPANVRLVIAGRLPPAPGWLGAPGWQGLFRSIRLEPLPAPDAQAYLRRAGLPEAACGRINRLARGHPLALSIAASLALSDPGRALEEQEMHGVIDQLSRLYLEAVPDAATRRALEAASILRCVTEPLLGALLPEGAYDAFTRLAELPFAEVSRDGLFIHDAVRDAIASSLQSRDPVAHRSYRRAAWELLHAESRLATNEDLWRCTANLLFLLKNPVLREGFFPSGPHPLAIEPAKFEDWPAIERIVARNDPAQQDVLAVWWQHRSDAFHVARDGDGAVAGFYLMSGGADIPSAVVASDPVAAAICRDLAGKEPARALVIRRWLDRNLGESPSPTQGASWVDMKRVYIEMRGVLRWVYMTLAAPRPYAEVATGLGFVPVPGATVEVGGESVQAFVMDMGPGSVDSWLTNLVGAEVAVDAPPPADIFDADARELVLPWGRVGLTPLEFGLFRHLHERPGKAVSRYDLLEAVWKYESPTASNVVDAVVRSLRAKLGAEAGLIETVRGTGYRYRPRAPR